MFSFQAAFPHSHCSPSMRATAGCAVHDVESALSAKCVAESSQWREDWREGKGQLYLLLLSGLDVLLLRTAAVDMEKPNLNGMSS
jgi:hypothetical protein